jgi:hypothetical protein
VVDNGRGEQLDPHLPVEEQGADLGCRYQVLQVVVRG